MWKCRKGGAMGPPLIGIQRVVTLIQFRGEITIVEANRPYGRSLSSLIHASISHTGTSRWSGFLNSSRQTVRNSRSSMASLAASLLLIDLAIFLRSSSLYAIRSTNWLLDCLRCLQLLSPD